MLSFGASLDLRAYVSKYELPEDSFEGLFQFQYKRLINTHIIGIVYEDSIYVPMKEIFSRLMIYYEFDFDKQEMTGFYKKPENSYTINFNTLKIKYRNEDLTVADKEFVRNDLEIYVLPSFLRRVFDLPLVADFSTLIVYIRENTVAGGHQDNEDQLPITANYNRAREHDRLREDIESRYSFPMLFPREYSFLNGGLMDYDINIMKTAQAEAYSYATNLGMELLGGDLNFNTFGMLTDKFNYQNFMNWRFGFGKNPYLTQFRAGYITTSSGRLSMLSSQPVFGAMVTNDPVQWDPNFTNYVLEDELPPGWQVELYVNNLLREYQNTSTMGKYRFEVPLYYGRTEIELKFYGPKGEKYSKTETLRIPYALMPPGEISYSVAGGYERFVNIYSPKVADAKIGFGVNRWLSWYTGVRYHQLSKTPEILSKLSINLFDYMFMGIDVDPRRYIASYMNVDLEEYGQYYVNYANYQLLNPDPDNPQIAGYNIYMNPPALHEDFPLRMSLSYSRRQYTMGSGNILTTRTSFYLGEFRFSANYNLSFLDRNRFNTLSNFQHNVSPFITYVWRDKPYFLDFLKTTTFSVGTNYNIHDNQFINVSAGMSQQLFDKLHLTASVTKDLRSDLYRYNMSLMMNLDHFRSASSLSILDDDSYIFSQNLSGGVGYDAFNNEIFMNNTFSGLTVGTSAVVMRFFLDDNANGVFDEGEQIVPNVDAKLMQGGRRVLDKESGLYRYIGLIQYGEYHVAIDEESFPNPLWVAMTPTFTFVTDPNSTKTIDIACYSTGVVEGMVNRNDGDQVVPQAGVKVHILRLDSTFSDVLPVFSDGTFYKAGVPPGDYVAWVDSAQVAILNVKPVPDLLTFSVAKTTFGDFVEGLNFELFTQEAYLAKAENSGLRRVDDSELKAKLLAASKDAERDSKQEPEKQFKEEPADKDIVAEAREISKEAAAVEATKKTTPNVVSRIQVLANETKLFSYKDSKDVGLTNQMTEYLDAIAEFMKNNPRVELSIVGHADNFGTMKETQDVSDKRAETVVNYLVSKGISKSRLLPRGEGSRAPIASNTTNQGRLQNRRIEIMVID